LQKSEYISSSFSFLMSMIKIVKLSGQIFLNLQPTFCSYPKGGTFTTKLDLKTNV